MDFDPVLFTDPSLHTHGSSEKSRKVDGSPSNMDLQDD